MGQTLGEPITVKETDSCSNNIYRVGSSAMQGWRINMEDSHTHLLSLPDDNNAAFFAVYDGHGGARVSQYVSLHLHKRVVNNELYAKGDLEEAMKQGFLELDEQMLQDEETKEEMSGTTAITALIKDSTIYCANVGDSRAVASVTGKALALSYDHKPCNDEESKRIVAAGGWVEFNRVNGNLALSRALGDFGFKRNENKSAQEQVVTAYPEVLKFEITPQFEFLVLACDGIWDVMSNQEVVTFCRERLCEGKEPDKVCEELLDRCLAPDCELSGLGCDNMTAILVCLLNNDTWPKYLERISVPAEIGSPNSEDSTWGQEEAANAVVESQLAELGLRSGAGAKDGHALVVDCSGGHDEHADEFTTPSESPNGQQSHGAQEPCSDDEQPPTHFHVPQSPTQTAQRAAEGAVVSPEIYSTPTSKEAPRDGNMADLADATQAVTSPVSSTSN